MASVAGVPGQASGRMSIHCGFLDSAVTKDAGGDSVESRSYRLSVVISGDNWIKKVKKR